MERVVEDLRRVAARLFQDGRIDVLVGFEKGTDGCRSRPVFIRSTGEARKLTWDATCSQNLAVYAPQLFRKNPRAKDWKAPRVGFAAAACGVRSLIALVKERQAPRENIVVIGMPCRGMIDARKLGAAVQHAEVAALADGPQKVTATLADGRAMTFEREPLVQDSCRECQMPAPEGADVTVEGPSRAPCAAGDSFLAELAKLSGQERWQRFSAEVSRCIRCYACRQACPMCYCTECFAETNSPAWIGATTELSDTMIFHVIRAFHQAGRCVECDACVRACPMGIDLRSLTKKIAADVRDMFGFTPGFDLETPPPLSTFREDDAQDFISEPRRG